MHYVDTWINFVAPFRRSPALTGLRKRVTVQLRVMFGKVHGQAPQLIGFCQPASNVALATITRLSLRLACWQTVWNSLTDCVAGSPSTRTRSYDIWSRFVHIILMNAAHYTFVYWIFSRALVVVIVCSVHEASLLMTHLGIVCMLKTSVFKLSKTFRQKSM